MVRRRLIWQLYPYFLSVAIAVLLAVAVISSYSFRAFYYEQVRTRLDTLARVFGEQAAPMIQADPPGVDRLCKKLADVSDRRARFTVVLSSGKVVGDSDEDPAIMENHSDRPEIADAFKSGFGWSLRFSNTLGKSMMYVAVPIKKDGEAVAVARTSVAVTTIGDALEGIYVKILWGGVVVALCIAVLSLVVSRRISRPIVQMEEVAKRFAAGELDVRVPVFGPVELASLAQALNEMAGQLHERFLTITKQRNELEAVLTSMIEGVIAVDADGRILSVNHAAAELLGINPSLTQGRTVEEAVRDADFQRFVGRTLAGMEPTEEDICLPSGQGRCFQLHGARIGGFDGGKTGAVIVIHDVTQIRRLENIRRDFVANVSHELRTPVTSIQGFAEALLEKGTENPEQVERYLKIIAKHSDRLNAIIEDLLSLSRLEEDAERRRISLEEIDLGPIIGAAVELTQIKASEKNIAIALNCSEQIKARVNSALLEQAVVNLVDNAIKYSKPDGSIRIDVEQQAHEIAIAVTDNGCGIERKYLSRLFERFYVVDKGRSRSLGGTGLGLAIVKHIAQVHNGSVTVQSTPGKGSTFTIHLPVA
ncbi:MAG: HAMP domain-containing protein [Sedimentisphaerales bacterium]|nr:HAMP domain-containing protein [Sedimentisphaerales bacterium]